MALTKLPPIVILPAGVDQRREATQLPLGKLRALVNMHQPTPGLYEKRNGWKPMDTISDDATGVVEGAGRGIISSDRMSMMRTTAAIYTRSNARTKWQRKANSRCAYAPAAQEVMLYGYKPCMVKNGNYLFYFCGDVGQNTAAQGRRLQCGDGNVISNVATQWYYRIVDAITGAEVKGTTAIAGVKGWQAKAVVSGGFTWLFVGAYLDSGSGNYSIKVAKISPDPSVAVTVTTYYDAGAGPVIDGFDVMQTYTGGVVVWVYGGQAGSPLPGTAGAADPASVVVSLLNTATGLPLASPGTVRSHLGAYPDPFTADLNELAVQALKNENGSGGGSFYVARVGAGLAAGIDTFNSTTLAASASVSLAGYTADPSPVIICGYRDQTTGHFVTFTALISNIGTPSQDQRTTPEGITGLDRKTHNAAGTLQTASTLKLRAFPVTEPFQIGSTWYLIAGHDDNLSRLQQAYYLLEASTGKIVGRTLYGAGGDVGQRATYTAGKVGFGYIGQVTISNANQVSAALNAWNGQQYVSKEVIFVLDDDAWGRFGRIGPMCRASEGQEIAIPDAWPLHLSGEQLAEYVPMYPRNAPTLTAVVSGGLGMPAGVYAGYYLWAFRDSAGNVHRSRPSPVATVQLAVNEWVGWTVENMVLTNSATGEWFIELYMTEVAVVEPPGGAPEVAIAVGKAKNKDPFLQFSLPNVVPTVYAANLTQQFTSREVATIKGETLYSHNNAQLLNDSPPPFAWAATWRNRMIVGDTDRLGIVWVSKEKENGFGYSFSGGLIIDIQEGSGRIYAGGAIDINHFAVFKRDGIWILSGVGPDKNGANMFEVVRLPFPGGCVNPNSVATTPRGLVFQATKGSGGTGVTDGGMHLITRSLEVVYIGAGIEDYRGRNVSAAVFIPEKQQLAVFVEFEPRIAITIDGYATPAPLELTTGALRVLEEAMWHIPWGDLPGTRFRVRLTGTFASTGGSVGTLEIRLGNASTSDSFGEISDEDTTGTTIIGPLTTSAASEPVGGAAGSVVSGWFSKPTGSQSLKICGNCTVALATTLDDWTLTVEVG